MSVNMYLNMYPCLYALIIWLRFRSRFVDIENLPLFHDMETKNIHLCDDEACYDYSEALTILRWPSAGAESVALLLCFRVQGHIV